MVYLACETLSQNKGREGKRDKREEPRKAFVAVLEASQAFCWNYPNDDLAFVIKVKVMGRKDIFPSHIYKFNSHH